VLLAIGMSPLRARSDNGEALLLQGDLETILLAGVVSAVAVAGLAVALGGLAPR
jgi:hypothetical protein